MMPAAKQVFPQASGIRCLKCRRWVERPREQPSGAISMPNPGDFWLCRWCGELHRFGTYGLIQGLPALVIRLAELEELADMDPDLVADLLAMRDKIRGGAN